MKIVPIINVLGRNHVNETAWYGIVAHRLWEENLGNVTKVLVNDSFGFVAQTLSQKGIILDYYFLFWDKVWATKPKTSGNEPKGISNHDLGYVSQIFLPKTNGNDTIPCIFFYVIAPLDSKD